jgi:RHS repeat-associated protein
LVTESGGPARCHVWEGLRLAAEYDADTGQLQRRYWAEGEEQFPPPGTSGPATPLYYVRDHLGSVRELVDATGTVRARYDYTLWGERTKLSGDRDTNISYTGHQHHTPSGLIFAPYRAYSADLGRWLSRDPIEEEGGINLYGYVANSPLNYVDPDGLTGWALNGSQGYWDANYRNMIQCHEYQQGFQEGMAQGGLMGMGIASLFIPTPYDEVWIIGMLGKRFSRCFAANNAGKGLGNPFKGKTAAEIDEMFKAKGFEPRGSDPLNGKGGYVNPKNQRSYHIDKANSFGEPPHVDVNRLKTYKGPLEKKKYEMGGGSGS